MEEFKSIGFVGLGMMGVPMVENVINKTNGHVKIYVNDVVEDPVKELCSQFHSRVEARYTAKDIADASDIIISMVPEGRHVRQVYLDPHTGVLASDVSNKILIDCSTVDTATSLAVREAALNKYPTSYFVDAPVSGGVLGAQKASLTFMIGASDSDPKLPLLKALLGKMGKTLVACGGPSLGLTAKLCNNYCSGLIAIAVSEAMNIGIRSGMDPRILASVFHSSTAQSAICDAWNPVPGLCPEAPASKGYEGGFKVGLMKKDFGLAVEAAQRVGAGLRLGGEGLRVYEEAMGDERCRGLDSRVVYRYLGGVEEWEEFLKEKSGESVEGDAEPVER